MLLANQDTVHVGEPARGTLAHAQSLSGAPAPSPGTYAQYAAVLRLA
jgi:hypothetical protein